MCSASPVVLTVPARLKGGFVGLGGCFHPYASDLADGIYIEQGEVNPLIPPNPPCALDAGIFRCRRAMPATPPRQKGSFPPESPCGGRERGICPPSACKPRFAGVCGWRSRARESADWRTGGREVSESQGGRPRGICKARDERIKGGQGGSVCVFRSITSMLSGIYAVRWSAEWN